MTEIKVIPSKTFSGWSEVIAIVGGIRRESMLARNDKEKWSLIRLFAKRYGIR